MRRTLKTGLERTYHEAWKLEQTPAMASSHSAAPLLEKMMILALLSFLICFNYQITKMSLT